MKVEDLPRDVRWLAEMCGLQIAIEVWRKCRGCKIPLPARFSPEFRRQYIKEHWDGTNVPEIARNLNVDERTIYRDINEKNSAPRNQTKLF